MSECTDNSRKADVVIAKKFFYNLYIDNFENNGKNRKELHLILSSIDDPKLRIDKRITKNENRWSKIEKTQQNLETCVQNLQIEVQ